MLSATRAGGLSTFRARSVDRSRALRGSGSGILLFGLGLNGFHELVNISLKVDTVFGVDGFVVSDRLGVCSRIRSVGSQGLAASRRAGMELAKSLGVTALEDHGSTVFVLRNGTLLIFGSEWGAHGSRRRRAVIWHVGEAIGSLVVRCRHGLHRSLGVRRANDVLHGHGPLLHLRRTSIAGVIRQQARSVHHVVVEVVGHVLRPASPIGVRGRLSSESQFVKYKSALRVWQD